MNGFNSRCLPWALLTSCLMIALSAPAQDSAMPGQWRIVNYWSEWCSPCRKEIPMLNALYRELDARRVALVGVNFDDDPEDVTRRVSRALGIEFPTLGNDEVAALGLRAPDVMPTTYIVTPDNQVAAKMVGLQTRDQLVAQLSRLGLFTDKPRG